jgi:hypothetical protein
MMSRQVRVLLGDLLDAVLRRRAMRLELVLVLAVFATMGHPLALKMGSVLEKPCRREH